MTALILAPLAVILPPCETETEANCYWNASQHGNGHGVSFVDLNGTAYPLN